MLCQMGPPDGEGANVVKLFARGALAALFLLILAAFGVPPARAQAPSVEPVAGPPETKFTFRADGFGRRESLGWYVVAPDGAVLGDARNSFEADGDGRARWDWRAPRDSQSGEWKMVAVSSRDGIRTIVIPFEIVHGALPPEPPISVQPADGPPGTVFTFAATGFRRGETVAYWTSAPDGATVGGDDFRAGANGDGYATWTWRAPADAVGGTWLMVGHGVTSGVEQVVRFTIGAAGGPPATASPIVAPPAAIPVPKPDSNVEPRWGGPGATFAFYVTGLRPGERFVYWASSPDGRALGGEGFSGTVDITGRADLRWAAPQNAVAGPWLMVVYGLDSRQTRTVRFDIAAPAEGQ
jgi:hypothetical protein